MSIFQKNEPKDIPEFKEEIDPLSDIPELLPPVVQKIPTGKQVKMTKRYHPTLGYIDVRWEV